jgi:prophage tail gpP-like protein
VPQPYSPAPPDKQQVRLRVMDEHVDLTRWTRYSFASSFLTPTDGWSCTIGDGDLAEKERRALVPGARVRLYVDQSPLAEGFIDAVSIDADRSGGVQYTIEGRDRLGLAVDSIADPTLQFKKGATLADVLKELFAPFGWVADEHFQIENDANRDAKTGGVRGVPMTKGGKKKGPRPLKDFVLHQLKPHNHEGVFAFASRITQRFGLWIWCSADGDKLIVGRPDFQQEPRYQLRRTRGGDTNVLAGAVKFDMTDQPSVLIADGFSGGGEFGKGRIKAFCVNPYFGVDEDGFVLEDVTRLLQKFPDAEQVVMTIPTPYRRRRINAPIRPMFLHDDESKTQEQLNSFVRREMSLLLRKSMTAHYTVEGHGQLVGGAFTPWDVDTVVEVHDEVADVRERMYVLARTFEKSRQSGTHTRLELVRLNSIQFGDSLLAGGDPTQPTPADRVDEDDRPLKFVKA